MQSQENTNAPGNAAIQCMFCNVCEVVEDEKTRSRVRLLDFGYSLTSACARDTFNESGRGGKKSKVARDMREKGQGEGASETFHSFEGRSLFFEMALRC